VSVKYGFLSKMQARNPVIILQLKSTQERAALANISAIIKKVSSENSYKIRGHEIHQVQPVMHDLSLEERVETVSRFCRDNNIEYLTYHAPILGPGDNIWEEEKKEKVKEAVRVTCKEAEIVCRQAGIASKAIVVFHLTSYVKKMQIPSTREEKVRLIERAEREFLMLYKELETSCILAVENTYTRYMHAAANIGPFHPAELVRMKKFGIATTFDFAHYQLYSNYLVYGKGNAVGDLDRQFYGRAPGWRECAEILGDSLVQLHISDAKGTEIEGEALQLGEGEIPLVNVLEAINSNRVMRGTLELGGGHLNGAKPQLEGTRCLLKNARHIF
jgi:hypothetical protein